MPIPDKDLDRMMKNLKQAFDAASGAYESGISFWGAANEYTRKHALELAAISQAYLAAAQERDRRAEEAEKRLPGKSLRNPAAPKEQ